MPYLLILISKMSLSNKWRCLTEILSKPKSLLSNMTSQNHQLRHQVWLKMWMGNRSGRWFGKRSKNVNINDLHLKVMLWNNSLTKKVIFSCKCKKGLSLKDFRSPGGLSSWNAFWTRSREGGSSYADVRTFWYKKLRIFQNLWCVHCPHGKGGREGVEPVRTRGEMVNFLRFCADVFYGQALMTKIVKKHVRMKTRFSVSAEFLRAPSFRKGQLALPPPLSFFRISLIRFWFIRTMKPDTHTNSFK